jgi:hypothetical protein
MPPKSRRNAALSIHTRFIPALVLAICLSGAALAEGPQADPAKGEQKTDSQSQVVQPLSVEDFLLDQQTLHGTVAVKGNATCMGATICSLVGKSIANSVLFDPAKLPRDDRKRLLTCTIGDVSCTATVAGAVGHQLGGFGLVAEKMEWQPTPEDLAAADPSLPSCDKVDPDYLTKMVDNAPIMQMVHTTVTAVQIIIHSDKAAHKHCTFVFMANGVQGKMSYYVVHQGNGFGALGHFTD